MHPPLRTAIITENRNGTYNVNVADEAIHRSVEQRDLGTYLALYGISGEKFNELMGELRRHRKATVTVALAKSEGV